MLTILVQTFFMVFFAEMGDKTQLLVMALSSKYKAGAIMGGIALAQTVLGLMAVLLGKCIAAYVPMDFIYICAGVLFLVFALFSLFPDSEEEKAAKRSFRLPAFLAVAAAFFVAELGDRTQITTMTSAATVGGSMALAMVFLGASLAMLAANGIAVWFTVKLGKHIPEKVFKAVSVIVFAAFGFWSLFRAMTGYLDAIPLAAVMGAVAALFLVAAFGILYKRKRC
ncbi:MAG: TMEM165/GDT1 family protein [Clostridia bacterium]|nr:TMEM165/GDT1 family protein [Clostridia bacterium]